MGCPAAYAGSQKKAGGALVLLEQNKRVKVKPGVDPLKITEKDIAENPRKLVLTPIEATQLPRTLDYVEFAIINATSPSPPASS
jgi:ABC-type metal ion transport system substrate-binding protein